MWFLALTNLMDRHMARDVRAGRETIREVLVTPAELLTCRHTIRLDGKWGTILLRGSGRF